MKNLLFFVTLFIFVGCKNISSQYSQKTISDRNVCFYLNVENNAQRIFIRRIKESPNVTDFENCDYFVLTTLYQIQSDIMNAMGIRVESRITMNLVYDVYKNDKTKIIQIRSILDNPILQKYEQYTGSKGGSMSKGSGVSVNEHQEKNYEIKSSQNVYVGTKTRIDSLLKKVSQGNDVEDGIYMVNNALLTSLQQSREDVENQLAKTLAERVLDDVVFDIINFEKSEHIKKCRKYYDKYMRIYFDDEKFNFFIKEKNTLNNEKKQLLEKSCMLEFEIFRKEEDKNKQNKQKKHIKRLKKEKNKRLSIIKSGNQNKIENYSLHVKKSK